MASTVDDTWRNHAAAASLNLIPTIQQAITTLLLTYEPEFLRFGYGLFLSFATILICWQGIQMMFGARRARRSDV